MKATQSQKILACSHLTTSTAKVIKTCKLGGNFNIIVRLFHSPKPSAPKSPQRFHSSHSSETVRRVVKSPRKVYFKLPELKKTQSPDDFIEPLQNLAIPSIEEYLKYTQDCKPAERLENYSEKAKFKKTNSKRSGIEKEGLKKVQVKIVKKTVKAK